MYSIGAVTCPTTTWHEAEQFHSIQRALQSSSAGPIETMKQPIRLIIRSTETLSGKLAITIHA